MLTDLAGPCTEDVSKQLKHLVAVLNSHKDVRSTCVRPKKVYVRFHKAPDYRTACNRELYYHEYMQRSLSQLAVFCTVHATNHLTTDWHICMYTIKPESV